MKYYCIKQHDITDCGAACLATICRQNGYKIDVQDLHKIEDAIRCILSDKVMYMKMSGSALVKSKEYDSDAMISKIEKILYNV